MTVDELPLKYCEPSSADANIKRLCFEKEGFLFREFDILFHDLFKRKHFYRKVLESVADKPLRLQEIYRKLKLKKAGYVSDCIDELIQTGFLARHHTWSIKDKSESKLSRVRIIDNYTRFYFKCIEPNKSAVARGGGHLPANLDGMLGLAWRYGRDLTSSHQTSFSRTPTGKARLAGLRVVKSTI